MKVFFLLLAMIIAGCVTHAPIPQPAPIPCEIKIKSECREMTTGEKNGAVVRGHSEDVQDNK